MLKAYLFYTKHQIAVIKLDKYFEGEARAWAIAKLNSGHDVYIGKYSVKHCKWRWFKFDPAVKNNFMNSRGTMQPELPKLVLDIATMPNTTNT